MNRQVLVTILTPHKDEIIVRDFEISLVDLILFYRKYRSNLHDEDGLAFLKHNHPILFDYFEGCEKENHFYPDRLIQVIKGKIFSVGMRGSGTAISMI